eukprot:145179_1
MQDKQAWQMLLKCYLQSNMKDFYKGYASGNKGKFDKVKLLMDNAGVGCDVLQKMSFVDQDMADNIGKIGKVVNLVNNVAGNGNNLRAGVGKKTNIAAGIGDFVADGADVAQAMGWIDENNEVVNIGKK